MPDFMFSPSVYSCKSNPMPANNPYAKMEVGHSACGYPPPLFFFLFLCALL